MKKTIGMILCLLLLPAVFLGSPSQNQELQKSQTNAITSIIENEKNETLKSGLISLLNNLDTNYSDLYKKLSNGGKIVIFIDPAHGRLPDGRWEGGHATHRLSCTGKPEEYYSIPISRAIYRLLSANKFIEVKSTEDYMRVLKGESDNYRNISFNTTVSLAKKAGAFIIISEHLNNVSMIHKASGVANIPGFHISHNEWGQKILTYIGGTYSGFLTLYNKTDASGFSKIYALKLKDKLVSKGFVPNSWDFGAVGDCRFSYFVDFPISVIYESGFVSNPDEEKKLRDPEHIKKLTQAQYDALMESIMEVFGVDISGSRVKRAGEPDPGHLELLKLARIAVFYLKNGNTSRSLATINQIQKKYSHSEYSDYLKYFSDIRSRLQASDKYFNLAMKYKKMNKNKKAKRYFRKAERFLRYRPIFVAYHKKFRKELEETNLDPSLEVAESEPEKRPQFPTIIRKASLSTPIIIPIEEESRLEEAVANALDPDPETLKQLTESFQNCHITIKKKVVTYSSKKKKKKVKKWKKESIAFKFTKGIYIVKLNKDLKISSVKRVGRAALVPSKFQNQQYLKNSYFAAGGKERAL